MKKCKEGHKPMEPMTLGRLVGFYLPEELHCSMCKEDAEVACPRDFDAQCLHCGIRLCGRHIVEHLTKVHVVSIDWRGFLK